MTKTINIEDITTKAVQAALDIVDEAADKTSNKSDGPCGDVLAYKLHETINAALHAHFAHPDLAPASVAADDLEDECCVRNLDAVDRSFKAKVAEAYAAHDRLKRPGSGRAENPVEVFTGGWLIMKKPKRTPGDWFVGMRSGHNANTIYVRDGENQHFDTAICTVYGISQNRDVSESGDEPGMPNAHLIAAAPELFEACKEALLTIAPNGNSAAIRIIRNAIAKAEGRA